MVLGEKWVMLSAPPITSWASGRWRQRFILDPLLYSHQNCPGASCLGYILLTSPGGMGCLPVLLSFLAPLDCCWVGGEVVMHAWGSNWHIRLLRLAHTGQSCLANEPAWLQLYGKASSFILKPKTRIEIVFVWSLILTTLQTPICIPCLWMHHLSVIFNKVRIDLWRAASKLTFCFRQIWIVSGLWIQCCSACCIPLQHSSRIPLALCRVVQVLSCTGKCASYTHLKQKRAIANCL